MGFEIINANTTNPERVCALLNYLKNYPQGVPKKQVEALFMPTLAPSEEPKLLTNVLEAVENQDLISLTSDAVKLKNKTLKPGSKKSEIRTLLMDSILDAKKEEDDNYRLALFFSWLIARTGRPKGQILTGDQIKVYPPAFNKEMGAETEDRIMNDVKFTNFVGWATFLGLGYTIPNLKQKKRRPYFIPYPVTLIKGQLDALFADKKDLPMPDFMKALGKKFPFLDGGSVFNKIPANAGLKDTITPTVSKIMRSLHDQKVITLEPATDTAKKPTKLYKDEAHTKIKSLVARIQLGH